MKKTIKYTNDPIDFKVIDDFLPSPEQLALKEDNVRVTITLSKSSVNFFKKHAIPRFKRFETSKISSIPGKRGIIPRLSEIKCCRFFETRYRKANGHYQSMIRKILDSYATHYAR